MECLPRVDIIKLAFVGFGIGKNWKRNPPSGVEAQLFFLSENPFALLAWGISFTTKDPALWSHELFFMKEKKLERLRRPLPTEPERKVCGDEPALLFKGYAFGASGSFPIPKHPLQLRYEENSFKMDLDCHCNGPIRLGSAINSE